MSITPEGAKKKLTGLAYESSREEGKSSWNYLTPELKPISENTSGPQVSNSPETEPVYGDFVRQARGNVERGIALFRYTFAQVGIEVSLFQAAIYFRDAANRIVDEEKKKFWEAEDAQDAQVQDPSQDESHVR